ncbi:MAG: fucose isomerase [Ruminococcaceae bacterium]|nr:fucose isomerase [Oscillospiraceae bacterium]
MENFSVAYVPIGVPTFHLESAQKEFDKSVELLSSLTEGVIAPDEMLLSIDKLNSFLDKINPDLIVLQNITFANSAYASEVLAKFSCPILLWTLREPVIDGGRLRLNSLTGAYSAANTIRAFREEPLQYVFGAPQEEKTRRTINAVIRAAKIKKQLQSLNIVSIGHTPQGFGFGRAMDTDMLKTFGARLTSIEARELINNAVSYSEDEVDEYLASASKSMVGLENTPEKNRRDFARLYKAYSDYVRQNNIGALSSRCWPDFFTAFGTPVCAVLALLNDLGVSASCEADTYGALTMYIGQQLTGKPTFFGDPVSLDEKENTITFWHCGTAACSLAREDTGAQVGVHCNRKIGPTLEFGCKPSDKATIFRIGKDKYNEFRIFICKGKILDKPKQFSGTSIVVETEHNAENVVISSVKDGWEPHFAIAYDDISAEVRALAEMLDIEVCEY